jgi:hypothetical protein
VRRRSPSYLWSSHAPSRTRFRPEFDTAPPVEPDALDSALDADANPARTEFTF